MSDGDFLPYGRQCVDEEDIRAVCEALRSDWLTTGPRVERFEEALGDWCGGARAVAVNSGTAALHVAYHAAGLAAGTEMVTTPLTFASTANVALHLGARVRFADVHPDTGLIDPACVEEALSPDTRLVVPVDYTGHPADSPRIMELASARGFSVVADGAHSFGATLDGRPVGTLAHATALSFHPVKPFTSAEGGAVVTGDPEWERRMRLFRNHGMERDAERHVDPGGPWHYEIQALGLNYRIPDVLCALGISQLRSLPRFLERRREIAAFYLENLTDLAGIELPTVLPGVVPGWHLFVVRVREAARREALYGALRSAGLGVQVHYEPVHLQPLYRDLGHRPGEYPHAEDFTARCLSLPLFPAMTGEDSARVVGAVRTAAEQVL